jgi:hypothetical protein
VKIQRAEFLQTFYRDGHPIYVAGHDYPVDDVVRSQVLAGNARMVRKEVGLLGYALHVAESYFARQRDTRAGHLAELREQRS